MALRRTLPLALTVAVSWGASQLTPVLSPMLVALVIGAAVANSPLKKSRVMTDQTRAAKTLLRVGVALLGLRLPIGQIAHVGLGVAVTIIATVAVTYASTLAIGDRLGLQRNFVTLVAAGFSICGAAAIIAVADSSRSKERDVALAVAMVTIFGTAMIAVVPIVGHMLSLSDQQTAIWAGASIHEVAQVVAVGSLLAPSAIALATTVKLGRVVLLAPIVAASAHFGDRRSSRSAVVLPGFVVAFVIAIVTRSVFTIPSEVLSLVAAFATLMLAAGMFGLGLAVDIKELVPVPLRAVLLAGASTAVAACTSLALSVSVG